METSYTHACNIVIIIYAGRKQCKKSLKPTPIGTCTLFQNFIDIFLCYVICI